MKFSQNFSKTQKNIPSDELSKNAQLLIRAGFVHKEMAGVYAYLPFGYKVLQNIIQIIREEMNALGSQELIMTSLQDSILWSKTNRWGDAVDVWFTTKLKEGKELGLGFTHEEPFTNMMRGFVQSYKDLDSPKLAYQFQTKFRNESRAKSGIMRTREFIMKDLYSFAKNQKDQDVVYEKVKQAYTNIFNSVGIGEKTFITFASGGTFSKYSHEFQTICDAGEDLVYICKRKSLAINKEVLTDEVLKDLEISRDELEEAKTSEVGNIFNLGTKFSEPLELFYTDENGDRQPVFMGSYGIGPGRLMGVIAELMSDERGLVWPQAVAPYVIHLVSLHKSKDDESYKKAEEIYNILKDRGVEIIWDDREASAGEKFADADLIGIPTRILVSEKSLKENNLEMKDRKTGNVEMINIEDFLNNYQKNCE